MGLSEVGLEQGFVEGKGEVVITVVCGCGWDLSFSLTAEEELPLPLRVMASVSVLVGVAFRTQQHGPSDLSHWHPVFWIRSEEPSVKVSSHVTKILSSVSMPAL